MAFLDTVRDQLKPDDTKAREQLDILKKAATQGYFILNRVLRNSRPNPA